MNAGFLALQTEQEKKWIGGIAIRQSKETYHDSYTRWHMTVAQLFLFIIFLIDYTRQGTICDYFYHRIAVHLLRVPIIISVGVELISVNAVIR